MKEEVKILFWTLAKIYEYFLFFIFFSDKQQEVDINNLRLEEEFAAGSSKVGAKGAGAGGSAAPLSLISGVKRPLGVTNRCC